MFLTWLVRSTYILLGRLPALRDFGLYVYGSHQFTSSQDWWSKQDALLVSCWPQLIGQSLLAWNSVLRSRGVHVAREWAVTVFICPHLTNCVAARHYDDDTTTRERISAWLLDRDVCCPGRYSASRLQTTFLSIRTVWSILIRPISSWRVPRLRSITYVEFL